MKILVIEDDKKLLKVLKRYLTFKGYEVVTLEQLKNSYSLALNFVPDIIISDYELPSGNTRELLGHLGQALPQTSCLVMSGRLIPNLVNWLPRLGFAKAYFISKPFSLPALQAVLDEASVPKLNYFSA